MNDIDFIDFDEPTLSFGAALKQNVSYKLILINIYIGKIKI